MLVRCRCHLLDCGNVVSHRLCSGIRGSAPHGMLDIGSELAEGPTPSSPYHGRHLDLQ